MLGIMWVCLIPPSGLWVNVGIDECSKLTPVAGVFVNPLDFGNFDNIFNAILALFELQTGISK